MIILSFLKLTSNIRNTTIRMIWATHQLFEVGVVFEKIGPLCWHTVQSEDILTLENDRDKGG